MATDDPFTLQDPARRHYLMQCMIFGGIGLLSHGRADAFSRGLSASKLATNRSIFTLKGEVRVNGRLADLSTRISAGDRVSTGAKSEVVFAVGDDSFLLRDKGEMEIDGVGFLIRNLRILSGGLLSVFGKRNAGQALRLSASTATMGVRGTGVYLEVEPDLTYLCTCYGQVALAASDDLDDAELITTTNHDSPRYISRETHKGSRIRPAPVINHDNTELQLLESIVGREVPKRLRKPYRK